MRSIDRQFRCCFTNGSFAVEILGHGDVHGSRVVLRNVGNLDLPLS